MHIDNYCVVIVPVCRLWLHLRLEPEAKISAARTYNYNSNIIYTVGHDPLEHILI